MLSKGQLSGRNEFDPNPTTTPILSTIGHAILRANPQPPRHKAPQ